MTSNAPAPRPSLITLLAALANAVSIALAFFLTANGNSHVDALLTGLIGPALATVGLAYQNQVGNSKADTAAVAAIKTADTTDAIHTLVNGSLEARILNVVSTALPAVLKDVLAGTESQPPLLAPSALAAPKIEEKPNG